MAFHRIRPKSGTAEQWERANTVLGEREIGYEYPPGGIGTGVVKMKMGDGKTAWNDLPYAQVVPMTADDIVSVDSTADNKVPSAGYVKKKFDESNSNLTPKEYPHVSYSETNIENMGLITTKIGNIANIQGYFNFTVKQGKNIKFLHVSDKCHPTRVLYIPVVSDVPDAPKVAKMDSEGYVYFESDAPIGWYFINISYPVNQI